jgi:putative ABC transport system ATP-binding protein
MSGGQQQRVAVARAMVNDPSIILADEPTANLDSDTAGMLLDMMESVNRVKGITFVFSSHDPRVMERARRSLIMRDGRID